MKAIGRIFTFFIFAVMISVVLYFQYGTPPFSAIPTQSMVPVYRVGDLVMIRRITPSDVKVGDVIVVDVPKAVQERFDYPPNLIHRVVKVNDSNGQLQFRLKGDNNNGQDPFTVLPEDIIGTATASYRYLGYPILFLNSKQGFYFLISSLSLYILYIVFEELKRRDISLRKGIVLFLFSDVLRQTKQIEEGQQQIIDLLSEKNKPLKTGLPVDGIRLDKVKSLIERNRGLIEEQRRKRKKDRRYEELLEALDELQQQLSGAAPAKEEVEVSDEVADVSINENHGEPQELPPRKTTRKKKFF